MNDEQTTLGAICELTPGDKENPTWVNGEFTATVSKCQSRQTKTGQTMITGELTDPDTGASINFSAFGRKVFPPVGSIVQIGGQGISLGEYNGTPQLTFGAKATVNKVGGSAAPQNAPAAQGRSSHPPARNNAPTGQGNGFLGVTVGMAINNAALDMRHVCTTDPFLDDHDAVAKWVWQRASVYLRVAQALEAGKLSGAGAPAKTAPPPPADEPPPARRAPAPTASGAAFDDDGSNQDVPF